MEQVFSDFSGGINALAAVDKLNPNECLYAQNVRLDETGNILSAGAYTNQNAAALAATTGTNTTQVHSLFWNPSLGAVAGVGADVFTGNKLSTMTNALQGKNLFNQKMSFASSPNRVYFDVGNTGYWTDQTNLLTVDWPPPSASAAIVNTSTLVSTVTSASSTALMTATGFGFAVPAQAIQGIQSQGNGRVQGTVTGSGTLTFKFTVSMYVNGVQAGNTEIYSSFNTYEGAGNSINQQIIWNLGSGNDLWGNVLSQGIVNASNFGFLINLTVKATPGLTFTPTLLTIFNPVTTVYQASSGFVFAAGAAGNLTGTYTWKITFVAANGEESDGSIDSTAVALANQQGTGTAIPTGDARTVSRNIYRKGGALTAHYLVGSIPDNTTTTYSDNQTDLSALAQGTILSGDVPGDYPNARLGAAQVRFPVLHYDRIFWINQKVPNQILWSKPLNGFAYPSINFINVGNSEPATRLVSIFGELIIVKKSSIWRLTGTDENSFDLSQTPSAQGTDESFTVTGGEESIPDKVLFHNRYGFWMFNGYTSVPLTTKLDLWQKQDDRSGKSLFPSFRPPEVFSNTIPQGFDACANSEKYYFSYAYAGAPQNNNVLVFDLKHGNITVRPVGALSITIDPVNGFVYMGTTNGFVSLLDDWNGTTAAGGLVPFEFQHGYQDLQRGSNKALWALEFYVNTNGQSLTPFVYYDNGVGNEQLPAISTTVLQRVVRTMEAPLARKMQNFSWRLSGQLSTVNLVGVPQVQIVHVKALFDLRVGRARTGQT